ncbi:MAG TPA: AMP-binding protein [Burkholderiales bacterium]|nr:AMP-binding protein [Burkholderiales bacterium]
MNIARHVARAARTIPHHPAIIFEGESVDYATLDAHAARLARSLIAAGARPRDRIALYLPNIPAFALAYLAVQRAGGVAVSLNPTLTRDEVKFILDDCGACIVFTVGELVGNVPQRDCPTVAHVVVCEGSAEGALPLCAWIDGGESAGPMLARRADDPAALLYTSGTTGQPKGATLSVRNVVSNARLTVQVLRFDQRDKVATFLPLFHVFAQNVMMNAAFEAGATLLLFRRFDVRTILRAVETERATLLFAVAPHYAAFLSMQLEDYDLSSLRFEVAGAAPLPDQLVQRWQARTGRPIYQGYGLTETSPLTNVNLPDRHRLGSVGKCVPGVRVRIVDADDREVPRADWGEICFRGPGIMQGYWNQPGETARALRGGWLHTGDIGRLDDDGYLFIVDRVKDMINVAGLKVWPAEVEQVLYRHPDVQEAAVYGAAHRLRGEEVYADVVPRSGARLAPQDIVAFCRAHLAPYKVPHRVNVVEALPKSATGKMLKRVLRERVADASA